MAVFALDSIGAFNSYPPQSFRPPLIVRRLTLKGGDFLMADEEIHSANITISGIDDTGAQIKIRDHNRQTYSFFKTKKDGAETEAYKNYQHFKPGDTVLLTFKEVPYKNGTIKNVMTVKPATGEPDTSPAPAAAAGKKERPGREYWEKREAVRQSSILMQVAFKAAVALEAAKIRSGTEGSKEEMYENTLEFYDFMAEQIGEETGQPQGHQSKAQRQQQEENRDDEIMF
jgi:hypothetical protein